MDSSWLQLGLGIIAVCGALVAVVRISISSLAKVAAEQVAANAAIAEKVAALASSNQEAIMRSQTALILALDTHFVENRGVLREIAQNIAVQTEILRTQSALLDSIKRAAQEKP